MWDVEIEVESSFSEFYAITYKKRLIKTCQPLLAIKHHKVWVIL